MPKSLRYCIILLCIVVSNYHLCSQSFSYPLPELISVSFSSNVDKYIEIKDDDTDVAFSAPHFLTFPPTSKPIGFVRNSKIKVKASFNYPCTSATSIPLILVKGKVGVYDDYFPSKVVYVDASFSFEYENESFEECNQVDYINEFKIEWKASFDNGATWVDCGSSVNKLYITLDKPISEAPDAGYLHYQTLLHIGCFYGSGKTKIEDLFDNVKSYFNTRQVKNCKGVSLKYYGDWNIGSINTSMLLKAKDGQCRSWSFLLLDILKAQGYTESQNYWRMEPLPLIITIAPPGGPSYELHPGFYVKEWTFSSPPNQPNWAPYEYENIWGDPSAQGPENGNSYFWGSPNQVVETTPLPGQNQPHPHSRFGNHQFVKFKNIYYDPSYGQEYNPLSKAEDGAGAFILPLGSPFFPSSRDLVSKNSAGTQEMGFTPDTH